MSSIPANHNFERELLTHAARDIFSSALAECSVEQAFARKVTVRGTALCVEMEEAECFELAEYDRIRIIAAGKAAEPMLQALLSLLPVGAPCDLAGVLAVAETFGGQAMLPEGFLHFASSHPLPNAASLQAAQAARAMLAALPRELEKAERSLCIFLISGGASAMLEEPLDAEVSLDDTARFHEALIHCGASIAEINCVRKHFSAVKGGRLALAAPRGTRLLAFFVSDVPSLQLANVGSGPVLPDPTTIEQCQAVIDHYGLREKFPASVKRFFEQKFFPESPKPGAFSLTACTLLESSDLVAAAKKRALQLGFRVGVDNSCDDWEYMAAARYLLERLEGLRVPIETKPEKPKAFAGIRNVLQRNPIQVSLLERRPEPEAEPKYVCLLSGGEVKVRVESPSGVGGRNQQLALYAATQMQTQEPESAHITVLSAGSDGVDGNSSAAGAIADSETMARAEQMGMKVEERLAGFDAFSLFDALGDTVMTGPTGNNLRDLRILLTAAKAAPAAAEEPAPSQPARTRRPRMKVLKRKEGSLGNGSLL